MPSKSSRKLSFGLKFRVLFSGVLVTIGLVFTLMGGFVGLIFGSHISFTDMKFSDKDPITIGKVTKIRGTSSYYNDVQIFEYSFEYTVKGKKHTGVSFKPGGEDFIDPEISRIVGTI